MDGQLALGSTKSLSDASAFARRTMRALDDLEKTRRTTPATQTAPSRRRATSVPTVGAASADELAAGNAWAEKVGIYTVGEDLMRLAGDPNIELDYNRGDPIVTATPSLHALRALGAEARDLAIRLERPAPLAEFEAVRLAAQEVMESVAHFHDEQVRMFERLTPRSFEDGSYQRIGADIEARYQPLAETMTPPAKKLLAAFIAAGRAIEAALRA